VIFTHDSDFAPVFERIPAPIEKFVVGWRDMARELPLVAKPIYVEDIWHKVQRVRTTASR
jgi:hypothetical protein